MQIEDLIVSRPYSGEYTRPSMCYRKKQLFPACALIPALMLSIAAAAVTCAHSSPVIAPPAAPSGNQVVDREIERIMREYKVIGLSFTAVRSGRVIARGSYGFADVERKTPVTPDTIYRIASISKPFTATVIMQLVERGLLGLDDDVSRHLGFRLRNPRFPRRPVTIRHLLTHTSGLRDGGRYDDFLTASYGPNPPPLTSMLLRGGDFYSPAIWRRSPPGRDFYYTNLAFGILATIAEKVTRSPFDEYCRSRVFEPLKMNASFNVSHFANLEPLAVLYYHYSEEDLKKETNAGKKEFEPSIDNYGGKALPENGHRPVRPGFNAVVHSPQGGVRASADDCAHFMLAHINDGVWEGRRILKSATARRMRRVHWEGRRHNGIYRRNGLGFHITRGLVPGTTLVGHSGRAYGFQGAMFFNPATKWGVIIMMNGGDYYKDEKGDVEFHDIEIKLFRMLHDNLIR